MNFWVYQLISPKFREGRRRDYINMSVWKTHPITLAAQDLSYVLVFCQNTVFLLILRN